MINEIKIVQEIESNANCNFFNNISFLNDDKNKISPWDSSLRSRKLRKLKIVTLPNIAHNIYNIQNILQPIPDESKMNLVIFRDIINMYTTDYSEQLPNSKLTVMPNGLYHDTINNEILGSDVK